MSQRELRLRPETVGERVFVWAVILAAAGYVAWQMVRAGWLG